MKNNTNRYVAVPVLATVYALLGVLSIMLLIPGMELSLFGIEFRGDLMMGFVMLVVAGIFAFGTLAGRQDQDDWMSFAYVGTGLAVVLLSIQIVLLLVDSFHALVLVGEGYELWTLTDSVHVAMVPGLICLAFFLTYSREMNSVVPSLKEGDSC